MMNLLKKTMIRNNQASEGKKLIGIRVLVVRRGRIRKMEGFRGPEIIQSFKGATRSSALWAVHHVLVDPF